MLPVILKTVVLMMTMMIMYVDVDADANVVSPPDVDVDPDADVVSPPDVDVDPDVVSPADVDTVDVLMLMRLMLLWCWGFSSCH
jgi:hypothetical protein